MTSPYANGASTPFALSGNPWLDPLINIGVKWGTGGQGVGAVVTYSFPPAGAAWLPGYMDGEPFYNFQSFDAAQQAAARQALALWSDAANISFQEVPDTASDVGDIRFAFSGVVSNSTAIAWAYFPSTNNAFPEVGDIWLDATYPPNLQMAPGQWGFSTLLHEIGHAIGLDHPFDDGFGEPSLPVEQDNTRYTVMSYTQAPGASTEAMSPMLLDIVAIQHIYGANMNTRTGNDIYTFSNTAEQLRTIWDAGGIDTIDASNQTLAATISLDAGTFSSIGRRNAGGNAQSNIAIAFGVTIENATGGSGGDNLYGNAVANVLTGNNGNDTLDGKLGADTLRGGRGNDIYIVDNVGDVVEEQGNSDTGDEVRISTSVNLATFAAGLIEHVTALGTGSVTLVGNSAANIVTGNAAANVLDGATGADVMRGGAGNDIYLVDSASDVIDEGSNKDAADEVRSLVALNLNTLGNGQIENVILLGTQSMGVTGNALNNTITGNSSANALSGGDGSDTLKGMDGNDTLTGAVGEDVLDGGTGTDVMDGGAGNDTYYVDSASDKVTESGTTDLHDRVMTLLPIDLNSVAGGLVEHATLLGSSALFAVGNSRNNTLVGNAGTNVLLGNLGNDSLEGSTGADTMLGGAGNDVYVVRDLDDVVHEQGNNDASDRVLSFFSVDLATFAAGAIEEAILMGAGAIDASGNTAANVLWGNAGANILDGRGGNDYLFGVAGADTLVGGAGNDILNGGGGADADVVADLMKGGEGNDVYFIDFDLDTIDEEGHQDAADEVRTTVSVDLSVLGGGAIENAIAVEGSLAVALVGNSQANLLVGNSGDNQLDGAGGNDTLRGGAGSDIYTIDSLNDVIDEQGNKDGGDEVRSSALSLNIATLAGGAIEHARLFGSDNLNLTGNTGNNSLFGNDGDNAIDGGDGNDSLMGGGGNDVLTSGAANDSLYGDTGNDILIVPTLAAQTLDGGSGFDEVKVTGGGVTIDLRAISDSAFTNIESIDLTGAGNNQLIASAQDVSSLLAGGSSLFINGDAGDTLVFTDKVTYSGVTNVDGVNYKTYDYGSSTVYLDGNVGVSVNATSEVFLAKIDDSAGFRVHGVEPGAQFGSMSAGIGDMNQDGFEDALFVGGDSASMLYGQAATYDGPMSSKDPVGASIAELGANSGAVTTVSGSGDFNGDGIEDFAVGDWGADFAAPGSGGAYIVYGKASGPSDQVSLWTLGSSDVAKFSGASFGQAAGGYRGLAAAGDMNGDGYDDQLLSAYSSDQGIVYVGFGRSDQPSMISSATLNGNDGFAFTGTAPQAFVGRTIAGESDFNGDGYSDIVISSTTAATVIFGHAGAFDADLRTNELTGSNGFTITGGNFTVGPGGDFNGDGYDDVVVANKEATAGAFSGAGYVYVIFGKQSGFTTTLDISQLNGANGFRLFGGINENAGTSITLSGDYNGDGYDDLLIGAPGPFVDQGSAYVVYGHSGSSPTINLGDLNGQTGMEIHGATSSSSAGDSVAAADLNGDGLDEIIIGASGETNAATSGGAAYVLYGQNFTGNTIVGTGARDTVNGGTWADAIAAGQGNDSINGGGGADAINTGQGNDEIHVADNKFFRIDGGTGVDTLHLDYAGAIDFANLDGNVSTSDRNRIENVEVIDVDNAHVNALTLHLADVLDLDATISDVGGVASLDNVLRIDGNAGDTLQMFNVDGWGAADTSSLTGYAIYSYQAVKVAVDADIVVSMT